MPEVLPHLPRDTIYYRTRDGKVREYPKIADWYITPATEKDLIRDAFGLTGVWLHRRLNIQPHIVADHPLNQELQPRRYWIHVGGVNSYRTWEKFVHDEDSEYIEIP